MSAKGIGILMYVGAVEGRGATCIKCIRAKSNHCNLARPPKSLRCFFFLICLFFSLDMVY